MAVIIGSLVVAGNVSQLPSFDDLSEICFGSVQSGNSNEREFWLANANAMKKMMANMRIKTADDIDRAFVEMMVPHHQGAIDMAKAELRYGRNERLKRLAQEIVVTQQQEVVAMGLALERGSDTSAGALQAYARIKMLEANVNQ